MRVLVAPDKFAGTLTAVEAAEAIAAGWARQAPDDVLDLAPMSDGGPGFVDVLHAALGGELLACTVRGPFGEPVEAMVLVSGDTAYLESAQACGLHLTGGAEAERASTYGVGELLGAAVASGATDRRGRARGQWDQRRGSGTARGPGCDLVERHSTRGPRGSTGITEVDLGPARAAVAGTRLVAASDVESPLTGLFGATKTFGPQKGIPEERLPLVDGWLEQWAAVVDRRLALEKGAGSAGGLGFALLALGATRAPGIELVVDAVGLRDRAQAADLVLTGEGAFDFSSRSGKVPYGVAAVAETALRPCVAVAGQVLVGSREMRALGVESAYALVDLVGKDRAFADPAGALADLAERVARTWSR